MPAFSCTQCCRHCWGLSLASPCWAPSGLQLPKPGESSSCPGPHSFCRLFPLYIGILAISGLKFLKALRGTASILGCSKVLRAFCDAERGCKHFRILRGAASILGCSTRRGPFLKEEVLGSFQGSRLGRFCWEHGIASGGGVTGVFCWFI